MVAGIQKEKQMISTTGTSIDGYLQWLKRELDRKEYGEVSLRFTIHQGKITLVKKESIDSEKVT